MQHERGTRARATSARQHEDNQVGNHPTGSKNRVATADQRVSMIQVAAYLRAERRGFQGGDPTEDWIAAERDVDAALAAEGREVDATTRRRPATIF